MLSRSIFGLSLLLSVLTAQVSAEPTNYGECVAKNKQFGGATAACAEDICR